MIVSRSCEGFYRGRIHRCLYNPLRRRCTATGVPLAPEGELLLSTFDGEGALTCVSPSRDARAPLSRSRQEAFDAHLERLDVDAELCSFICMFADHKEHREYVQWMEAVKRAVEE